MFCAPKHVDSNLFECVWTHLTLRNKAFILLLDVGDQPILAKISFSKWFCHSNLKWAQYAFLKDSLTFILARIDWSPMAGNGGKVIFCGLKRVQNTWNMLDSMWFDAQNIILDFGWILNNHLKMLILLILKGNRKIALKSVFWLELTDLTCQVMVWKKKYLRIKTRPKYLKHAGFNTVWCPKYYFRPWMNFEQSFKNAYSAHCEKKL